MISKGTAIEPLGTECTDCSRLYRLGFASTWLNCAMFALVWASAS